MPTIPVLMYHHVNPNKNDMVTVAPDVFEAQMRHIRDSGYRTLSLDEVSLFLEGKLELPDKSVALTFDDGYLDNYVFAFPILKAYGIKAAVFIVTGWIDAASMVKAGDKKELFKDFKKKAPTHNETKRLIEEGEARGAVMDWEMISEMADSGLVEFSSHTVTHKSCDKLDKAGLAAELEGSKDSIEKNLKRPCQYLCWPRGRFSAESINAAKEAGYKAVYTTLRGVVKAGDDPFAIKRVVVKDSPGWFKTRLSIYTNPVLSGLYLRLKGAKKPL